MSIHAFLRKDYEVVKSKTGQYDPDTGLWVYDILEDATITIRASVQPASWKDIQSLPEGIRSIDTIAIYTDADLQVSEGENVGDLFKLKDKTFQIVKKATWSNGLMPYNYYIAQREGG